MKIKKRDGKFEAVKFDKIVARIKKQTYNLSKIVDHSRVAQRVISGIFDGVSTVELDRLAADTAHSLAVEHPDYSNLAARIAISAHHKEWKIPFSSMIEKLYTYKNPVTGKAAGMINDETYAAVQANKDALDEAIVFDRDFNHDYFGWKTLEKSYLLKIDGRPAECPQHMWMRVAVGIWGTDLENVLKTYEILSTGQGTHATPTLFQAGSTHPQMSSCFLLTMQDSLADIFKVMGDMAAISKAAGGIGLDISDIRADGSYIAGTNGVSNGIVPMLQVVNSIMRYVDQCFVASTPVFTDKGWRPISEISVGDLLLTEDGTFDKVAKVLSYPAKEKKIYKLLSHHCETPVFVTESHPVLALTGMRGDTDSDQIRHRLAAGLIKPEWTDVKDLAPGDFMVYPLLKTDESAIDESTRLSYFRDLGEFLFIGEPVLHFQHEDSIYSRLQEISCDCVSSDETVHDFEMENIHSYVTAIGTAHNGGGKRKGSAAIYMQVWHAQIFDLLDLKKNTGKEELRAKDLLPALWIDDLFMKMVDEDGDWALFSPNEAPGLSTSYGEAFNELYYKYLAEGRARRVLKARDVWAKIMESLIETGTPYMLSKDAANKKSNQQNLGFIRSSNLCCVTADQRVVTEKGLLTVGELYADGTANTVIGRQGPVSATKMLLPRPNAPIVKIHTKQGYTHKVTPDHKVWVSGRGWVEAQHLVAGDKLEIQQVPGIWGKNDMADEALLAGFIAGDGCFSTDTVNVDVWENEWSLISELEAAAARVCEKYKDLRFKNLEHVMGSHPTMTPVFYDCVVAENSCPKKRLSSPIVFRALMSVGFNRENKLQVPDFVWKGNEQTVRNYIRGLYLSDGTVQANVSLQEAVTSLTSVSKSLLEEIQILLCNFGGKSVICKLADAGERPMPDGKGGSKMYQTQKSYRLMTTGIRASRIIEDITGLGKQRGHELFLNRLSSSEGYVQKMTAEFTHLETLPNEDAYCLSVNTEEHSWTCNGMITKNTEIIEYTDKDNHAVCNLFSIALSKFVRSGIVDYIGIKDIAYQATVNLNQVIDKNYYPTPECSNSNFSHRPIGIGVQGLADLFAQLKIAFDSPEAAEINKKIFETIYFGAVSASADLAVKDGAYSSFAGSPASQGKLQYHLWGLTEDDLSGMWDWKPLVEKVKATGLRNSLLTAPMPTASTSQILGNNECFEWFTSNMYSRKTLGGEFPIVNRHLVAELEEMGLWTVGVRNKIILANGSVQNVEEIPVEIRARYKTMWETKQRVVIDLSADRGPFICQSQSLNLHFQGINAAKISSALFYGWKRGLKTLSYYVRGQDPSQALKGLGMDLSEGAPALPAAASAAVSPVKSVAVQPEAVSEVQADIACSLDNPEACDSCGS